MKVKEINGWTPPLIWDRESPFQRIATQADIDRFEAIEREYRQICQDIKDGGRVLLDLAEKYKPREVK